MTTLYFMFSDPLTIDYSIEEKARANDDICQHLQLNPPERYLISVFPRSDDPPSFHIFVDDLAICDRLTDVSNLPFCVSKERKRRTVWINPPSVEEKIGIERSIPWNTHYTEYFQIYMDDAFSNYNIHTIKYWKRFEDLEMYDPSPLARARYEYLYQPYQEKQTQEQSNKQGLTNEKNHVE